MSNATTDLPRRHRLTVEEYNQMGEVGILHPEARTELIDGEIYDIPPPGGLQAGTVIHLNRRLHRAVGDDAIVSTHNPILLGMYSEPGPDLALLKPRRDFYKSGHPKAEDVLLVVEVADSSLPFDRDVKVALYARHGVQEVWLIDVRAKRLKRYRDPAGGAYGRVDEPDAAGPIELPVRPGLQIDLAPLFEH